MSAKTELLHRLAYLDTAINTESLIDEGIIMSPHNGVARLLRKGLGIVAFNMLEDFIKKRTEEALLKLAASGISFNNLTEAMKEFTTIGALKSLAAHINFLRRDPSVDIRALLQQETQHISSTRTSTFTLSKYSFVYLGSNIQSKEIKDLLSAFGIPDCWRTLKSVSDAIGGGIPDLAVAFQNASSRRNQAAHNASFDYLHSWLVNLKREIIAISASLDIILTAKCRQVIRTPSNPLDHIPVNDDLKYRYLLVASPSLIKEKKSVSGRTLKNWSAISTAKTILCPKLQRRREFLIILDSSSRVVDWEC